jgi:hypothetical protein
MRITLLAAALAAAIGSSVRTEPTVRIVGGPEIVIPAISFGCSRPDSQVDGSQTIDVPDAPPRMIRRADGLIELFAAHHNNIPFYSRDGAHFGRSSCTSAWPSKMNPAPSAFADQDWVVALYTRDGQNVFALLHDEYHGPAHIPQCRARLANKDFYWAPICLSISLTGAVSHDQGSHFIALPGDLRLVATAPSTLGPANFGSATRMGIRDTSNIVRSPVDGYYYFLAAADPYGAQVEGTCVFRSGDPFAQPWFAWDGQSFGLRMGSPYEGSRRSGCSPVFPASNYVSALSWNTVTRSFLAIGRAGDGHVLYATTSTDLIHWAPRQPLKPSVQDSWWKPGEPAPESYFSIIDPASPSRSFDVSGGHPYIYLVRWQMSDGRPYGHRREIIRIPLMISPD